MLKQVDLEALADFLAFECDCSEEYEEDCFSISLSGERFYVERHVTHFAIEHDKQVFELPRC